MKARTNKEGRRKENKEAIVQEDRINGITKGRGGGKGEGEREGERRIRKRRERAKGRRRRQNIVNLKNLSQN